MGRRYDRVLMISRREARILWTSRKPSKRISEKAMDFGEPENRIGWYLWVIAKFSTNTSCSVIVEVRSGTSKQGRLQRNAKRLEIEGI
jgi:hypothetical protein